MVPNRLSLLSYLMLTGLMLILSLIAVHVLERYVFTMKIFQSTYNEDRTTTSEQQVAEISEENSLSLKYSDLAWSILSLGVISSTSNNDINVSLMAMIRSKSSISSRGISMGSTPSVGDYCIINIHGFHHSGTGVMELKVIEALNQSLHESVSYISGSDAPENEGQFLQDIYPSFVARSFLHNCPLDEDLQPVENKGKTQYPTSVILYACPGLLSKKYVNRYTKSILWKDWSKYFDLEKGYYLVQKTPTFDAAFLDSILPGSIQIINIRHPLFWQSKLNPFPISSEMEELFGLKMSPEKKEIYLTKSISKGVKIWLEVVAYVMNQAIEGKIKRFAFVRFEELMLHQQASKKLLEALIVNTCDKVPENIDIDESVWDMNSDQKNGNDRRILHVRENGKIDLTLLWNVNKITYWKKCLEMKECRIYLEMINKVSIKFGYNLVDPSRDLYISSKINNLFIFTSKDLENNNSKEKDKYIQLVNDMKSILDSFKDKSNFSA